MKTTAPSRPGFSLVEVVLALGIATFCVVALLGLFSVGLASQRESRDELQAANIAQSLIAMRRISPSVEFGPDFPLPPLNGTSVPRTLMQVDENGRATTSANKIRYWLKYEVDAPASNRMEPHRVYLSLLWPGNSPVDKATGQYELLSLVRAP
ncbi:MAG: hypothetical protein BGO12_22090 [Verrucomicrobia bacterium 61-8]|nr:hypothetical protein [Verrucomicrobiota bacterium]OJV23492.1 MAG: hypothetical protein BGO12_22090 [Verrucomicrobia bacterium 61-8]